MPYMMRSGPPELMPVIRAAEMPNHELVSEKPTPSTDQTEKFLFISWVYPISASLRASSSTEDLCIASTSGETTGEICFSCFESIVASRLRNIDWKRTAGARALECNDDRSHKGSPRRRETINLARSLRIKADKVAEVSPSYPRFILEVKGAARQGNVGMGVALDKKQPMDTRSGCIIRKA
jgi:hypothetical protein